MRKIILFFNIVYLVALFLLVALLLTLVSSSGIMESVSGYFLFDFDNDLIEKSSPYDRVKEEQIKVYDSLVIMHITNSELVSLENTNSMDPLLDENSNVIQIMPKSHEDIHIGDIVSYRDNLTGQIILHRVVGIGEDERGKFFVLKGDNLGSIDQIRVRLDQIMRIVIAVVY